MKLTLITKNKTVARVITVLITILLAAASATMSAHAADNPLKITVEQIVVTSSVSAEIAFNYRLKPLEPDNPMPSGSTKDGYTFTVTGNRSTEIGPLRYSRAGVYRYELSQLIGTKKPGYTYDYRVYEIEAHVDAVLKVRLVVKNTNGTKANKIEFENRYHVLPSDPKLMADPTVKKTVSGNPGKDSVFTFNLTARDTSYPMPSGSVGRLKTIQIIGSGESKFGTWSYDKEGVYYYTVHEVNNGEKGYTYDAATYNITDTVKDENGRLVVSRTMTNDLNKQVTILAFINKYSLGENKPHTNNKPKPNANSNPNNIEGKPDNNSTPAINSRPDIEGKLDNNSTPAINSKPDIEGKLDNSNTPAINSKPGPASPKTGDEIKTILYYTLFVLGGTAATGAAVYLLVCRKRKKGDEHENI